MNRKIKALIFGAMLMSVLSCAKKPEEGTNANAPAQGTNQGGATEQTQNEVQKTSKELTIYTPLVGLELDEFTTTISNFTKETGIPVNVSGDREFEKNIVVRAEGNNLPDIAAIPQPGLLANLFRKGYVKELSPEVVANIQKNYSNAWQDIAKTDGKYTNVPFRSNVKSIVWYPKKAFAEAGYEVPKTWDEMIALCDKMVANGETPWALGLESGGATGWPGTDWIEDLMLRTAGTQKYDEWTSGKLKFDSPEVREAFGKFNELLSKEGYIYGGRSYATTTNFGDAVLPLFEKNESGKPKAWFYKMGEFVTSFMPKEIQQNADDEAGFFILPAIKPEIGTPILGGSIVLSACSDNPDVMKLLAWLATGHSTEYSVKQGTSIYPHKDQDFSLYPTKNSRALAEILVNAEGYRFDGSDLMPAAVGAGAFWTGMVDFVGGTGDLDTILKNIDDTWAKNSQ